MPQVPRLSTPQVQEAALPNMRVNSTPNAAAFGLGQANRGLLSDVASFAQKVKDDADETAVYEALTKVNQFENEFSKKMMASEGKNALGLNTDLDNDYQKTTSEITNSLSNPRQKAIFNAKSESKKLELDKKVSQHMGVQIRKYEDQVTNDYVNSEKETAINNWQSGTDKIVTSLKNQKDAIIKFAERHGEDPEEKIKAVHSDTMASVMSRMLTSGDDITAESFFNANKDMLLEKDYTQVAKELEIGSARGFAQRFADDIMKRGLDETQAYKEAAKIENPRKREAAESRIDKMFTMKAEAEKQKQEQLYMYAGKHVLESGSLDTVPLKVISNLSPDKIKDLRSLADSNPVLDDSNNFYKLKMLASNPETRSKFMAEDLSVDILKKLNKQHREEIIDLQTSLRNKDGKADKELDGIYSKSQVVQQVYENAGFAKNQDASFQAIIDKDVADIQRSTGKKLSNDEVRQIANKYAAEAVVSKGFFSFLDTKKPKYQILNEIPEQDRLNIEKALKSKGKPANNENILNLYLMKVNK